MDLEALIQELISIAASVWPEVPMPPYVKPNPADPSSKAPPRQFLTDVQAASVSFVEGIKAGTIALPCVVLEIGDTIHDPQWGVASTTYRAPTTIHYVERIGPGKDQAYVHAKARLIKKAIENVAAQFVNFQAPPELGRVDSSTSSAVDVALLNHGKLDMIAASVAWNPGLLTFDD